MASQIDDVSPSILGQTEIISDTAGTQSVSGKALCVAVSADGEQKFMLADTQEYGFQLTVGLLSFRLKNLSRILMELCQAPYLCLTYITS